MARITYEGIRDRSMMDESVCWGLHNATRELRDQWLRKRARLSDGSRLGKRSAAAAGMDDTDDRFPRDAIVCGDDEGAGSLNWVPYVHYRVLNWIECCLLNWNRVKYLVEENILKRFSYSRRRETWCG